MASALIFVFLFAAVMSEADCVAELMKMYQKLTEEKTRRWMSNGEERARKLGRREGGQER